MPSFHVALPTSSRRTLHTNTVGITQPQPGAILPNSRIPAYKVVRTDSARLLNRPARVALDGSVECLAGGDDARLGWSCTGGCRRRCCRGAG
jgi:hypothetical protein